MNIINNKTQLNLRKEHIVKGTPQSTWSTNKFIINDGGDIINIVKDKISSIQTNQYLNLSPFLDKEEYEVNIDYYKNIGFSTSTSSIKASNIGRLVDVDVESYNASTLLSTNTYNFFALDSYRTYGDKPYLVNGSKRQYLKDKDFTIPFISTLVKDIQIEGVTTIVNADFGTTDVNKYISYLNINKGLLNKDKLVINFRNTTSILGTLYLYKKIDKCLYKDVEVLFKNGYGVLETLYMNGRVVDNIDSDSTIYERDLIDINGNDIVPNKHRNKTLYKSGYRTWEVNTDNVPEYMNKAYEDLIYSQEVWLKIDGNIVAVVLEDESLNKQLDTDSNLINYTFSFREDKKITL